MEAARKIVRGSLTCSNINHLQDTDYEYINEWSDLCEYTAEELYEIYMIINSGGTTKSNVSCADFLRRNADKFAAKSTDEYEIIINNLREENENLLERVEYYKSQLELADTNAKSRANSDSPATLGVLMTDPLAIQRN